MAKKNTNKRLANLNKESQAQRSERLNGGFKARPCVMLDRKTKAKSRKVKHKGRLYED